MTNFAASKKQTTCIRGIAILLVIFGHLSLIDCSGAWGVHLFLIISGYGMYCSYESSGLKLFWKKRVEAVWEPYFFCTITFLLVRIFLHEKFSIANVIGSLIGLDFGLNIDPTMWYISYIFAMYTIFFFSIKIQNRKVGIFIAGVLQVIITGLGYLSIAWHRGTIAWAYVLSFPIGVIWGKIRNKEITLKKKKAICIFSSVFSALVVTHRYGKPHGGFEELLFTLFAALGIIAFFELITLEALPIIGGGIYRLGKISFFMYLNEYFVLLKMGFLKNYMNEYVADLLILIASVCLATVGQKVWNLFKEGKVQAK